MDTKFNVVNTGTPVNGLLSAHYQRSFAYHTIRDRLPVILTKVIDQIARDNEVIILEYGEESRNELRIILSNLSQLKYELQTNKEFRGFPDTARDSKIWNEHLLELNENKTFYSATWLFAECYFYRRIRAIFEDQPTFATFDYFRNQKETALTSQFGPIRTACDQLTHILNNNSKQSFKRLFKLMLWGNRCDLSITAGEELNSESDLFLAMESLENHILVDDTEKIYDCLNSKATSNCKIVDIVNDNSGYELFTDFCLADYIISNNLATVIRFHVKAIPWFISDVNINDFNFFINTLAANQHQTISKFGKRWSEYIQSGQFLLINPPHLFWTSGYEYNRMEEISKELYNFLGQSHLIIFKGDLNYRKLLGDINWKSTTPFENVLQSFQPSNLCSLRTIKADLICGLENGAMEKLNSLNKKWMETGEYGVIQFAPKKI